MHFLIEGDELLKKHNIWKDVSNSVKEDYDSEPVYNKIFLKTKIRSFGHKATDFHDKLFWWFQRIWWRIN